MSEKDFIVVGLGNPGKSYSMTRHNVGFMFLDHLARRFNFSWSLSKWRALVGRARLRETGICCVKPQTYMNKSGEAVAAIARYYNVPATRVVVVHDDIDMALGRIKLVAGGGSGGHNGIKSVLQHLDGPGFFRLKIGIGRPGTADTHPDIPVDRYVLSRFSEQETTVFAQRFVEIDKGMEWLVEGDAARAQTLLNSLK